MVRCGEEKEAGTSRKRWADTGVWRASIVAGDGTAREASSAGLDVGGWEPVTVRL
jgi:hypothetical protein